MKAYRIALIGTGKSIDNHLNAIRALKEQVELVAAVDIDETRLKAVCEANQVPRWYTNATDMLAAEQPDLVHIVTPPVTHKSLIVECLEAGAWVYCEKPLCASLAEFDEIHEAEQRTGRFVSTVFQWRFGTAAKHLQQMIQGNVLGRPLIGVCNTLWYRSPEYYQVPWRGKWATELGGTTMTLGIHLTDLFLWLLGDWREVYASAETLERAIEVEDVAMALVRFENNAMGTITNSVLSPRQESYMRLDFQEATVEVNALYRYNNEHWRFTPLDKENKTIAEQWQSMQGNITGNHEAQLREILDCMARNKRPLVSGLEARRILEFSTSLYKSAFTHKPVLRGTITPDDPFYYSMNGTPQTLGIS